MIIWYEQLAASPDRPSSDRIPDRFPPRGRIPGPNLPRIESSKNQTLPPSGYSVNRCYPLALLHGLPALTSWCLVSFLPAHVGPSADLPDCFPPFYHVVADQPVRSLDCHLPVCMLTCYPTSTPIICLLDSSVVHSHIWHHTNPPSLCQPIDNLPIRHSDCHPLRSSADPSARSHICRSIRPSARHPCRCLVNLLSTHSPTRLPSTRPPGNNTIRYAIQIWARI